MLIFITRWLNRLKAKRSGFTNYNVLEMMAFPRRAAEPKLVKNRLSTEDAFKNNDVLREFLNGGVLNYWIEKSICSSSNGIVAAMIEFIVDVDCLWVAIYPVEWQPVHQYGEFYRIYQAGIERHNRHRFFVELCPKTKRIVKSESTFRPVCRNDGEWSYVRDFPRISFHVEQSEWGELLNELVVKNQP